MSYVSTMKKTNLLLSQIATNEQVLFANFNQAFLTPSGELSTSIMPDLLHPNADGYDIWAEQLTPYINQYVR